MLRQWLAQQRWGLAVGLGLTAAAMGVHLAGLTERIELRYGTLKLRSFVFELPGEATKPKVIVRTGSGALAVTSAVTGTEVRITLDRPIALAAGGSLDVTISW